MTEVTQFATGGVDGVDPGLWYVNAASTTPETPAPPHVVGTWALGAGGAEYIFVRASTTINYGDFIAIQYDGKAEALTVALANKSIGGCRIGMAAFGIDATVRNTLTYVPAGAYFWAAVRGGPFRADTSTLTTPLAATGAVQLYATTTGGVISSVTTPTIFVALEGIICLSSTKPYVYLTWPRTTPVEANASLAAGPTIQCNS